MQIVPFVRGAERQKELGSTEGWAEWHSDSAWVLGGGPTFTWPYGRAWCSGAGGGWGGGCALHHNPARTRSPAFGMCILQHALASIAPLCSVSGRGSTKPFPPSTHVHTATLLSSSSVCVLFSGLVPLGAGEPRWPQEGSAVQRWHRAFLQMRTDTGFRG